MFIKISKDFTVKSDLYVKHTLTVDVCTIVLKGFYFKKVWTINQMTEVNMFDCADNSEALEMCICLIQ